MRFRLDLISISGLAIACAVAAGACAEGENLSSLGGGAGTGTGGDGAGGNPGGTGGSGEMGGASSGTGGMSPNTGGSSGAGTGGAGGSTASGGSAGTGGSTGTGGSIGTGGASGSTGTGGARPVDAAGIGGDARVADVGAGGMDVAAGGAGGGAGSAGIMNDASTSDIADVASPDIAEVVTGTVVFREDFENDALASRPAPTGVTLAPGWTRVGGSDGDWEILADGTQVLAQDHAQSSTFRVCYATASTTSGASTVSARMKILANGSSGVTTPMVCVRYVISGGAYNCLALEPGSGAQFKTNTGDSPVIPMTIALATSYDVALSINASGLLSGSIAGSPIGTFQTATTLAAGVVAVATQSAEASFDVIVVTTP